MWYLVGELEGLQVGVVEGIFVGSREGAKVGVSVGSFVAVGSIVGGFEGPKDGDLKT